MKVLRLLSGSPTLTEDYLSRFAGLFPQKCFLLARPFDKLRVYDFLQKLAPVLDTINAIFNCCTTLLQALPLVKRSKDIIEFATMHSIDSDNYDGVRFLNKVHALRRQTYAHRSVFWHVALEDILDAGAEITREVRSIRRIFRQKRSGIYPSHTPKNKKF